MACDCENITCLSIKFNPCSEGAVLPLVATETGTWSALIEFNGMWSEFGFGVVIGQPIVIPSVFLNEYYIHTLQLFNTGGALVNNTCYSLDAKSVTSGDVYPVIPPGSLLFFDIVITEAGNTITDARLDNKTVSFIVTDAQAYNDAFWDKPFASDTLTSTVLTFYIGQIVTIVLS